MTTAKPVALVTGASSGIGKAASLALVEAGFEVVGTSRKASGIAQRDGVTFLDLDVTSDESVRAVVRRVIERFGRLDVLVNNAGTGAAGAAEESSVAQDQRVFDINFFGLIRMTKAVLPHMRAQASGRIINISSVLGLVPAPYMASYAATKHAIEGYSESVDHEVREHGVRVLLVEPAYTRTGFDANAIQPDAPLPIYAEQRQVFDGVMARAMAGGDDPATVAESIVAAATDPKPKLRYTAGSTARRVSALRRFVPAWAFDRQIRKLNRLPAGGFDPHSHKATRRSASITLKPR
jgi:NAD(P)-dependent dehydrogenase (short-subunit alcohol dehydrogenase family)